MSDQNPFIMELVISIGFLFLAIKSLDQYWDHLI